LNKLNIDKNQFKDQLNNKIKDVNKKSDDEIKQLKLNTELSNSKLKKITKERDNLKIELEETKKIIENIKENLTKTNDKKINMIK